MTRAVVFLAVSLVATSLGLFAQDNSRRAASVPAAAAITQTSGGSGAYQNANKPASPADSSAQQIGTADKNAGAATSSRAPGIQTDAREEATANGQLPQTSTILPLLGLIGLGSLIAGLFARR